MSKRSVFIHWNHSNMQNYTKSSHKEINRKNKVQKWWRFFKFRKKWKTFFICPLKTLNSCSYFSFNGTIFCDFPISIYIKNKSYWNRTSTCQLFFKKCISCLHTCVLWHKQNKEDWEKALVNWSYKTRQIDFNLSCTYIPCYIIMSGKRSIFMPINTSKEQLISLSNFTLKDSM